MPFQPAIATCSLGHPSVHSIDDRLQQAAAHGFKLIELVEDDLLMKAKGFPGGETDSNKLEAARVVKDLCDRLGLRPFVLQPFRLCEGLLDQREHEAMIEKLRLWMKLVKVLDVQLVQIPSNWLHEGTTGDVNVIVKDFIEMAEMGLQQDPVVSFAYEGVAWGAHIDTWQGTWDIVQRVNRPNFGLCLDTFHIAARVWGDPTLRGCKRTNGDAELAQSLSQLVKEVDVSKVFYLQIGDAEALDEPLIEGHAFHSPTQAPRMSWSRNARLFAFEEDERGCLPIEPIANAIVGDLGFQGYLSMETFSRKMLDEDPAVPAQYAAKGMQSWQATMKRLQQ